MLLSVHKPKVAFFMTTTQTFETILTGSYNIVVFLTICISYANNCFTL